MENSVLESTVSGGGSFSAVELICAHASERYNNFVSIELAAAAEDRLPSDELLNNCVHRHNRQKG